MKADGTQIGSSIGGRAPAAAVSAKAVSAEAVPAGDPFLRKSLTHFHWPLVPSLGHPLGKARRLGSAGRLSLAALADSLDPAETIDRSRFVPRNHLAQLSRIGEKLSGAAAAAPEPVAALAGKVRALLKQEVGLAEDFHGRRRMVIPC